METPVLYIAVMWHKKISVVLALLLGTAYAAIALGALERTPNLAGTVIQRPSAAPDFTLTDQHGMPFRMADTKGKVVVMTFIYTHCTDLCPFLALKLKNAHDQLGADAAKAVFVAVSTDPERDTRDVIAAYSRAAGLENDWHYVTGPHDAVKEVWFNYGVGVQIEHPEDTHHDDAHHHDEKAHQHDEDSDHGSGTAAFSPEVPTQGLSAGDVERAWKLVDEFGEATTSGILRHSGSSTGKAGSGHPWMPMRCLRRSPAMCGPS